MKAAPKVGELVLVTDRTDPPLLASVRSVVAFIGGILDVWEIELCDFTPTPPGAGHTLSPCCKAHVTDVSPRDVLGYRWQVRKREIVE